MAAEGFEPLKAEPTDLQLSSRDCLVCVFWARRECEPCRARLACADEGEVGEAHVVAEAAFDVAADRIEELGTNSPGGAAFRAVDVFPGSATGELVESGAVSEVDVVQQPVAFEGLEVSVDGGRDEVEPDCNLFGRQRGGGGKEGV